MTHYDQREEQHALKGDSMNLWLPKSAVDPLDQYRDSHGTHIVDVPRPEKRTSSVRVMSDWVGTKVSTETIYVLRQLGARSIVLNGGEITTIHIKGRAHIVVDSEDVIQSIELEIGGL